MSFWVVTNDRQGCAVADSSCAILSYRDYLYEYKRFTSQNGEHALNGPDDKKPRARKQQVRFAQNHLMR